MNIDSNEKMGKVTFTVGNEKDKYINDTDDDKEKTLNGFLELNSEINDIVITDKLGNVVYLFSRMKSLDNDYVENFRLDFK